MGFPLVAVKMPICASLKFLLILLTFIRLALILLLNNLGMFKPSQQVHNSTEDQDRMNSYALIMDELCPSPIPVPVYILTGLIKQKLQVSTYTSFLERFGNPQVDDGQDSMCPVCLDCIEGEDEVRELCNCCHVFHRKCLDSWVDKGQFTCPTCRSMLLPNRLGAAAYLGDPLTLDSISFFPAGDDSVMGS